MIPYIYRFHGHNSLKFVYKNGTPIRTRLFTMKVVPNPRRTLPRLAVVVSKKVLKSAVGRNRIRRRVYEVLRESIPKLNDVYDIVVLISSADIRSIPHEELKTQINQSLQDAHLYSV